MSERSQTHRDWIAAAVERYQGPLTLYASRLLHDVDLARDVVQETFLKLWRADREQVDEHLRPWLYTVCRNGALDVLRKDGRMKTLDERRPIAESDLPEGGPAIGRAEERGRMMAALAELTPREQEIVRLKFQSGLSYRQIAEVMDLTVTHVGVLIHFAVKKLRERLERAEPGASGLAPGMAGENT